VSKECKICHATVGFGGKTTTRMKNMKISSFWLPAKLPKKLVAPQDAQGKSGCIIRVSANFLLIAPGNENAPCGLMKK
jgi:hypothetical protein